MSELTTSGGPAPKRPDDRPWSQQPEENVLWYSRFARFVALGPGRSISLLAMGRRNAYPVPAHWPIQAKQWHWRERARAFDSAAKADPALIETFNRTLEALVTSAINGEAERLTAAIAAGGYHLVTEDDDEGWNVAATN